jgi:aspartokinase-like uncharacterized kinase
MRRVIKIGGSLLRTDRLAQTLDAWIARQPPAQTIAIVGGGELIDAVRRLDAQYHCDTVWVHWQCIALLQTTFQWLSWQLDGWQLHSTADEFERLRKSEGTTAETNHLVAVDSFYHQHTESPLPLDWTTTTDAIAGWLSILTGADELVLLKSCDVDAAMSLSDLADQGVIDGALPSLAADLCPVRCVNLATVNLATVNLATVNLATENQP